MPLDSSHCAATYKILVLGDASVGKSALLRRLMGREFQERLYPTIGKMRYVTRKPVYNFYDQIRHTWFRSSSETIIRPNRLFRRRSCSEPGPVLVRSKCLDEKFCFGPNIWIGPTRTTSAPRTRTDPSLVPILVRYNFSV